MVLESYDSEPLTSDDDQWISLGDLMSGLMMVFMLIAIIFMLYVQRQALKAEQDALKITKITQLHRNLEDDLYRDLKKEFQNDLARWGAELSHDLSIRFNEPDILFDTGKNELKVRFKQILNDFFPRYINILASEKYKKDIAEIRLEGHTSSIWSNSVDENKAYFNNMELSQDRTRSTLEYLFSLNSIDDYSLWLKGHITANGLSSSKLIFTDSGEEDLLRSQRVEFRVKTNVEEKMSQILSSID